MKKTLHLCFIFITHYIAAQQNNNCNCPDNTMAGTTEADKSKEIFNFSTGQQIILCGYKNDDNTIISYSEFILQECGKTKPVDFWEALFTGTVRLDKDVIYIKEIKNLPTGRNRSFINTHWSTETLRYNNNQLARTYTINHIIRKYDKAEIDLTLKEFEAGSAKYKGDIEEVM